MITIFIYSYKGKNLENSVRSFIDNASTPIFIKIKDQNPLTRESKFSEYKEVHYENVFWDHQYGPAFYRAKEISDVSSDYILLTTDDITAEPGWDTRLIEFIGSGSNRLVSGIGRSRYAQKDKYSLKIESLPSNDFTLSHIVDHNFIFGRVSSLRKVTYPMHLKYFGESEIVSVEAFCAGIDVYAAPTGLYSDNKARTLENLYSPFSIEHNYNCFFDIIYKHDPEATRRLSNGVRSIDEFLELHQIMRYNLRRLPYQNNDVLYDPNKMKIMDVGGERFIGKVKAIY